MTEFNLSDVFGTVSRAVPDREALAWRDRRLTYAQLDQRVDGFARFLAANGLGCHTERPSLADHQSGQDHVGLYLRNRNEYVEAMIGSWRARAAPVNVNFRYVADELVHVLTDAQVTTLVYAAESAPRMAEIRARLPRLRLLIQVDDGSGQELLPGAVDYESALLPGCPVAGMPEPRPEDLYILYTGGTTGTPKGVMWRQHDIFVSSMGGTPFGSPMPFDSYDAIAQNARSSGPLRLLVIPPLMHGAAQWGSFHIFTSGGTIFLLDNESRFDPADALRIVQREGIHALVAVGDAVVLPLVEEIERAGASGHPYDLSSLVAVNSSSAPLTPGLRARLLRNLPGILIRDAVGASETGFQMSTVLTPGSDLDGVSFTAESDTAVVDHARSRVLRPGETNGWLARRNLIPLGYLADPEKTAQTFPVIEGIRWSIPGDRADVLSDGRIHLLGRDNLTINSGGEKIYAEEVERAMADHPAVRDVLVVGRPSSRWGSEVVAVVQLNAGEDVPDDDLVATAARRLARYKLPKAVLRVPQIMRSPAGKADYVWAGRVATQGTGAPKTRFTENTITFPYQRSLGPVTGAFMSALARKQILGIRHNDAVLVPPMEWDPASGAELGRELVEVGPAGTVRSWTWVSEPSPEHPLDRPFAFAFVQLDGASTPLLHAVDSGTPTAMSVGLRVAPRWRGRRVGKITDIACFVAGEVAETEGVEEPAPETVELMEYTASVTYRTPVPEMALRAEAASRECRLIGMRCPICGRIFVGSDRPYCSIDAVVLGPADEVDLPQTGVIANFVVVTPVQYPGQTETEPFARVFVLLKVFDVEVVLIFQSVIDLPVHDVRVGLRVKAVWGAPDDQARAISGTGRPEGGLLGWTPSGEPDIDDPDLVNRMY